MTEEAGPAGHAGDGPPEAESRPWVPAHADLEPDAVDPSGDVPNTENTPIVTPADPVGLTPVPARRSGRAGRARRRARPRAWSPAQARPADEPVTERVPKLDWHGIGRPADAALPPRSWTQHHHRSRRPRTQTLVFVGVSLAAVALVAVVVLSVAGSNSGSVTTVGPAPPAPAVDNPSVGTVVVPIANGTLPPKTVGPSEHNAIAAVLRAQAQARARAAARKKKAEAEAAEARKKKAAAEAAAKKRAEATTTTTKPKPPPASTSTTR